MFELSLICKENKERDHIPNLSREVILLLHNSSVKYFWLCSTAALEVKQCNRLL